MINQRGLLIFLSISRSLCFVFFDVLCKICDLKNEFLKRKESDSAKAYDNFSRDVMDVRRHLKQRHATARCEGIRESMPISSKCADIE